MDKISKTFKLYVLPIYWAILTYMLLKPGQENQEYWFMFSGIDKVIHISIFILLGFCIKIAFPKISFYNFIHITLIYAFLTEILQEEMQLGRSMEFFDIIADTVGVLLGFFYFKNLKTIINKRYF